jgi:hypothetical protein
MQKLIRRAEIKQIVRVREKVKEDEANEIRHNAINLKVLRKQQKEIRLQPLTSRSIKRSASEIRDIKNAAPKSSLFFGVQNTDGDVF